MYRVSTHTNIVAYSETKYCTINIKGTPKMANRRWFLYCDVCLMYDSMDLKNVLNGQVLFFTDLFWICCFWSLELV